MGVVRNNALVTMTSPTMTFSMVPFGGKPKEQRQNTVRAYVTSNDPKPGFEDFIAEARERFKLAAEATHDIRRQSLDDLEFLIGNQWPENVLADRNQAGRPCLTINKLSTIVKQVTNQQRQARPSIQVNPVGSGADVDTAQIIQGLMRHIEINSDADDAYDTAFQYMAACGFGYWRLTTDYAGEDTFDQEISVDRIADPFTVYIDPAAQKPDRSDMRWAFIVQDLTEERFRAEYPDSMLCGLPDFRSVGDGEHYWFHGQKIRIAEYFKIEEEKRTLMGLTDGRAVWEEDLQDTDEIALRTDGKPLIRTSYRRIVRWFKMNGYEILEEGTIPGKWIPIIPVIGDEYIVNGRHVIQGMVRSAKDAQRMYNYARSHVTEAIALAPKAPWVAAVGQIEGFETLYQTANIRNIAVLPYHAKTVDNQLVPPPQRQTVEPPIQAASVSLSQSEHDLEATTGVYPPTLGEVSPEESGKAILARQKQGENANYNYQDNMARSIKHTGRVALDMLPVVYDSARIVRIVKPDTTHELVQINKVFQEAGGRLRHYDLTVGRYDITISTGPSYQSRRQEFVQSVISLVQAAPQVMNFVMDLLVRNMDWPGAAEIADRLKKMLPQQLQDDADQEAPEMLKAKLAQLMQQHAQLVQALQQVSSTLNTKRLELESKERIAGVQAQVGLITAELNNKSAEGQLLARLDYEAIAQRLKALHEGASIDQEVAAIESAAASADGKSGGQAA